MKIFFAADHAGFSLKQELLEFAKTELGYEVEDCGALAFDEYDDYPDFVNVATKNLLSADSQDRAVVIGASGQGEAMAANRQPGIRAAVYYGPTAGQQTDQAGQELGLLESSRAHNNANVLALGARFLEVEEAKQALKVWLNTNYTGDERHQRRITKLG